MPSVDVARSDAPPPQPRWRSPYDREIVRLAAAVLALGLGIGWLWAALGLLMVGRAVSLLVRFLGDRWIVLGAVRG